MVRIEPYNNEDLDTLKNFLVELQEHERADNPQLRPGAEVASPYLDFLLQSTKEHQGLILMARQGTETIGFICAWVDHDEDMLLNPTARRHGYVSDLFVRENCRGKGIGASLLREVESAMASKGIKRLRVCSKAANKLALRCYDDFGFIRYELIFTKEIGGS